MPDQTLLSAEQIDLWRASCDCYDPYNRQKVNEICDMALSVITLRTTLAAESERRERAEEEAAAVRELMNVYNLGGWTDAVGPMKRALEAERALTEAQEMWQAERRAVISITEDCRKAEAELSKLRAPVADIEAHVSSLPLKTSDGKITWIESVNADIARQLARTLRERDARIAAIRSSLLASAHFADYQKEKITAAFDAALAQPARGEVYK